MIATSTDLIKNNKKQKRKNKQKSSEKEALKLRVHAAAAGLSEHLQTKKVVLHGQDGWMDKLTD